MKKVLILAILSFFFFLTPKVAGAVSCQILTPADQIFINISTIEIKCTDLEVNKRYIAEVWKDGDARINSSGHCANSDNTGVTTFIVTPRHVDGLYHVVVTNAPAITCRPELAAGGLWQGSFTVNPAAQVTITPCQGFAGQGMMTALGCIPTKPDQFVVWFLRNAIGLGGGIAFLLIIWGAFTIITSAGNPEKLNNGKEIIVSAVSGLLMIIFSVVLLKIIGVDILAIPGFGK